MINHGIVAYKKPYIEKLKWKYFKGYSLFCQNVCEFVRFVRKSATCQPAANGSFNLLTYYYFTKFTLTR